LKKTWRKEKAEILKKGVDGLGFLTIIEVTDGSILWLATTIDCLPSPAQLPSVTPFV
jgi:hypothetical protein